jgi:uncharacterized protein (DUF2267 family)
MNHERFLSIVQREAKLDRQTAENATKATFATLSERLSEGQAKELVSELPDELAKWLPPSRPLQPFGSEEFLRRVAEREGVDTRTAQEHSRAVFLALSRAVTAKTFSDMASELPKDFDPLLEKGRRPPAPVMPLKEFLSRVADRAGIDEETARRASEAVLETLAERIAGGEVRDLMKELPPKLHSPLEAGAQRTQGKATPMSLEEFLSRVAEREGVSVDEARTHAHAVLVTLRDALVDKEFDDLTKELPNSYVDELMRP